MGYAGPVFLMPKRHCTRPRRIGQSGVVEQTIEESMTVAFDTLDPRFARMRDHLTTLRGGRRMPRRADLDPQAFADVLPYVNLIDVVLANDAVRFRFRLVGTAQSAAA